MSTNDDYRTILSIFRLGMNVIKKGCTECQRQFNKVICFGEEQAFLLELLVSDDQQWDIQDQKLCIIDKECYDLSLRCGERPEGIPILWNEEFVQLDKTKTDEENEKFEEEAIKHYIYSQYGNFRYWDKVCEPIVLLLAINSCNNVKDRDTLIHLCMNSQYGAVLFRKVIMKTLGLLVKNWFDDEKLEEIAKFFGDFLDGLSNYECQFDIEENIKVRSARICDRIQGSDIDMLYKEVSLQDRKTHGWVKGGDILQYFADIEYKDSIYYASRLDLIQRILVKKVKSDLWLEPSLIQLDCKPEMIKNTIIIRNIIDSIEGQDESRQKEAIEKLSRMIDLCVMDWIDEEVISVYRWILKR